jgi:hypothetical protein
MRSRSQSVSHIRPDAPLISFRRSLARALVTIAGSVVALSAAAGFSACSSSTPAVSASPDAASPNGDAGSPANDGASEAADAGDGSQTTDAQPDTDAGLPESDASDGPAPSSCADRFSCGDANPPTPVCMPLDAAVPTDAGDGGTFFSSNCNAFCGPPPETGQANDAGYWEWCTLFDDDAGAPWVSCQAPSCI